MTVWPLMCNLFITTSTFKGNTKNKYTSAQWSLVIIIHKLPGKSKSPNDHVTLRNLVVSGLKKIQ